jgi:hypothetical protein
VQDCSANPARHRGSVIASRSALRIEATRGFMKQPPAAKNTWRWLCVKGSEAREGSEVTRAPREAPRDTTSTCAKSRPPTLKTSRQTRCITNEARDASILISTQNYMVLIMTQRRCISC